MQPRRVCHALLPSVKVCSDDAMRRSDSAICQRHSSLHSELAMARLQKKWVASPHNHPHCCLRSAASSGSQQSLRQTASHLCQFRAQTWRYCLVYGDWGPFHPSQLSSRLWSDQRLNISKQTGSHWVSLTVLGALAKRRSLQGDCFEGHLVCQKISAYLVG